MALDRTNKDNAYLTGRLIAVTEHYDGETGKRVHAKAEYFKPEQEGILPQFHGFGNDLMERIVKKMN